jgi:hypothetical protein
MSTQLWGVLNAVRCVVKFKRDDPEGLTRELVNFLPRMDEVLRLDTPDTLTLGTPTDERQTEA